MSSGAVDELRRSSPGATRNPRTAPFISLAARSPKTCAPGLRGVPLELGAQAEDEAPGERFGLVWGGPS